MNSSDDLRGGMWPSVEEIKEIDSSTDALGDFRMPGTGNDGICLSLQPVAATEVPLPRTSERTPSLSAEDAGATVDMVIGAPCYIDPGSHYS